MISEEQRIQARLLSRYDKLSQRLARVDRLRRRFAHGLPAPERPLPRDDSEGLERLVVTIAAEIWQIRRALDQIELGQYGICSKCGRSISQARLAAVAEATECSACSNHTLVDMPAHSPHFHMGRIDITASAQTAAHT